MPHRRLWPVIFVGCLAIFIADVGGALLTEQRGIAYEYFALVTLLVYASIGVAVRHRGGSLAASAVAAVAVSLFELTGVWWITWQIGPGRMSISGASAFFVVTMAAKFNMALATVMAMGAGAAWDSIRRRRATQ